MTSERLPLLGLAAGASVALAALAITVALVTNNVVYLGHNIPNTDLLADYATGIAMALGLSLLIPCISHDAEERAAWTIAWAFKVMVVLVAMLAYENSYWFLDSYGYFDEPRYTQFSGMEFGSGTANVKGLIWFLYSFFPQSFHALKTLFAFFGLVAVFLVYRASALFLGFRDVRLFLCYALFPSILFWSSIIGKDPLALFGISLYIYGSVSWYVNRSFRAAALVGFGILVAASTRVWLGPLLMFPLAIAFIFAKGRIGSRLLLTAVVAVALRIALSDFLYDFGIASMEDLYSSIDQTAAAFSQGDSSQQIGFDLADPAQFVLFLPLGMFTALFRPLPGEVRNIFGLLAGLENVLLLFLLFRAIVRVKLNELSHPLIVAGVTLVLAWAAMYSFVSYGNAGNAVRYRLQILPVVIALLLYCGRRSHARRQTPQTQ